MAYLVLPKLLYVSLYSMYGSAIAYLTLFYSQVLHLSFRQIGLLLAIAPFVQVVACPFWAVLVEKYPKSRSLVVGVLAMIGGSGILLLYFLPEWTQDNRSFMMVLICAFMLAFFVGPICALVDSSVLKLLRNRKTLYGNQRLWGYISHSVFTMLVGILILKYGIYVSFGIFFVGLVIFVILSVFTHMTTTYNEPLLGRNMTGKPSDRYDSVLYSTSSLAMDAQIEANNELHTSGAIPPLGLVLSYIPTNDTCLSSLGMVHQANQLPEKSILKTILVYTFMISIFLYGLAHAMINQFLFLLLSDFGLNPCLIGLTGPIGGLAELITFWLSRELFDKYSVTFLMTMAYLSFIFRAIVYTCLSSYETKSIVAALILQLLNGFVYALVWSTTMFEMDVFFPANQKEVAQGISAILFSGISYGIASVLGGFIYDIYGPLKLFQISAFICSVSLIVFLSGRRPIS